MKTFKNIFWVAVLQIGLHAMPWLYYYFFAGNISVGYSAIREGIVDVIFQLILLALLFSYGIVLIKSITLEYWQKFLFITLLNIILLVGHIILYFRSDMFTGFVGI